MIWHLLAVFISGLSFGGIAYMLRKLSRERLPKWLIPVFAGTAMIGYLAYYDYTWYDFKRSQLPAEAVVIEEHRGTSFFKPWSYLSAAVNAFTAYDGKYTLQDLGGERVVEYIAYEFSKDPTERMHTRIHILNCSRLERVSIDPDNPRQVQRISTIDPASPIFALVCTGRP